MGYKWLKLRDGRVCIGTKGEGAEGRLSWSVLYMNGSVGAVNENQIESIEDVKPPKKRKDTNDGR